MSVHDRLLRARFVALWFASACVADPDAVPIDEETALAAAAQGVTYGAAGEAWTVVSVWNETAQIDPSRTYNSARTPGDLGPSAIVFRSGVGEYQVAFPGQYDPSQVSATARVGAAQVVAIGEDPARCQVVGVGRVNTFDAPYSATVHVRCHGGTAVAPQSVDSGFSVYLARDRPGTHVLAHLQTIAGYQSLASVVPDAQRRFNAGGGAVAVDRFAVGQYRVTASGTFASSSTKPFAMATAVRLGNGTAFCQAQGGSVSTTKVLWWVFCKDIGGAATDSPFSFIAFRGTGPHQGGYTFETHHADDVAVSPYGSSWFFDPSQPWGTPPGVGRQWVRFYATYDVTPFWWAANELFLANGYCKLTWLQPSVLNGNGWALVGCYDYAGALSDAPGIAAFRLSRD